MTGGLGHRHTFGRAFHLDAILAGEVERIFGKITLITFIVVQYQPKKGGRTTFEYVVDCPHGSDSTVTGNCRRASDRRGRLWDRPRWSFPLVLPCTAECLGRARGKTPAQSTF